MINNDTTTEKANGLRKTHFNVNIPIKLCINAYHKPRDSLSKGIIYSFTNR